jgi:hypothetical protein
MCKKYYRDVRVRDNSFRLSLFPRPIIEARMQKYKEGEIHFNLMGVVEDKIARYNRSVKKVDFRY